MVSSPSFSSETLQTIVRSSKPFTRVVLNRTHNSPLQVEKSLSIDLKQSVLDCFKNNKQLPANSFTVFQTSSFVILAQAGVQARNLFPYT